MYTAVVSFLLGLFLCALAVTTFSLIDALTDEDAKARGLVTRGALWGTLMVLSFMCISML